MKEPPQVSFSCKIPEKTKKEILKLAKKKKITPSQAGKFLLTRCLVLDQLGIG